MKEFNIPSDFKKETVDQLALLNRKHKDTRVSEVYGNITLGNYFTSGRANENLPQIDMDRLTDYVRYAKQNGIDFNYTFNATHLHNNEFYADTIKKIKHLLHDLYHAGVSTIIVALPTMYEIVRSTGLQFRIKASVLSEVTTPNRAMVLKKWGADRIVADESITRDFGALKHIVKAYGNEVELIANALCTSHCQYRMFHYNQISSEDGTRDSGVSNSFYPNRCYARIFEEMSNFMKMSWIRPEDLKYYSDIGVSHFKLQGRHLMSLKVGNRPPVKGDLMRVVEAYLDERFDGNLFDLITIFNAAYVFRLNWDNKRLENFIKPFVEKDGFCRKCCGECGYCEAFAKKVVGVKEFEEMGVACRQFFGSTDPFQSLIWNGAGQKPSHFPM